MLTISKNSINQTPNNGSKTLVDKKKIIMLEFSDNGIGVPDDRKVMIFKIGNRDLKGSKGMFIGLSLVKKIMKGYNVKIYVEDKLNKG